MKKVLIILLIVVLIPVGVLSALYFTVKPFRDIANEVLSNIPGPVGEGFGNIPGSDDIKAEITEVSRYLLKTEEDRAVDKLSIAESGDKNTFNLLIEEMNRHDPNRTARLLELLRARKLKDSPIAETLEKIKEEEEENTKMNADYISGVDLPTKVGIIRSMLDEDLNSHSRVARVLEQLSEKDAVDILSYLDAKDSERIVKEMDSKKALDFKKKIYEVGSISSDISNNAKLLKAKSASELATILGPGSAYSEGELVMIFREFGAKKAGEIFSKIDDDAFKANMISKIKDREILLNGVDTFTENLIDALNIYKEYDDKMNELVVTYREMDEKKVAETVRTLYWNTGISKTYSLKNGEEIVISDEKLALDLLSSFPPKKVASILSNLDNRIASDIFTKLALPKSQ